MNKLMKWLFAAVAFTGMCACSGEDALQQSSQVETSSVSFSFFDSTVEKFGEANLSNGAMEANGESITRAGDSLLTGDVQTRADDNTATTWKKRFTRLDIAIIPANSSQNIQYVHQSDAAQSDFGSATLRLPIGKYKMVAIASAMKGEVNIVSAEKVTFPEDEVLDDMAYVCKDIEVKSGSNIFNCQLERAISLLKFHSSDELPSGISKIEASLAGNISRVFNPTTGYGVKGAGDNTQNRSWSLANLKPGKAITISMYVFLSSEKETIQADLNIYNTDNEVIKALHFDQVTLQQNHVTTYTGPLFTSGSAFEFTFENTDLLKSDYDQTFDDAGQTK